MMADHPLAPLNGLVLAGGYSRRMGRDKGLIEQKGMPAREFMAQLIAPYCRQVWISLRPEQMSDSASAFPILPDQFPGQGPLGALYTAFLAEPLGIWFIMPCDLPQMNDSTLKMLVENCRNSLGESQPDAFLLQHPQRPFPEPLAGIWLAGARREIIPSFERGERAVHPLLKRLNVLVVSPTNPNVLVNQNQLDEEGHPNDI